MPFFKRLESLDVVLLQVLAYDVVFCVSCVAPFLVSDDAHVGVQDQVIANGCGVRNFIIEGIEVFDKCIDVL